MSLAGCQEAQKGVFWSTQVFRVVLRDAVFPRVHLQNISPEGNFHVKSLLHHQRHCLSQCGSLSAPLGARRINKGIGWRVFKVAGAEAAPHSLGSQWHVWANLQTNKRQVTHRGTHNGWEKEVWPVGPAPEKAFGHMWVRGNCFLPSVLFAFWLWGSDL